ncbi:putative disease resistance RPP13-like protein 1 [Vicia villosa]|uniref:putative disease resistance RPP13-like protein 1 n=1 Tax=Vicia villosa TaxID=3911 RepID=UPI00273BB305|nr:putative disease resistance RPP13-like protein 1 [Vicia villosa]
MVLKNLDVTLKILQSVLDDAEENQITNPAVKKWLNMLHDVVYEAEDLIDEINTEHLRRRVEADQVLQKFSSFLKRFNKDINSKVPKLFEKLQHLGIQNPGLKKDNSNSVWNVTPTNSVVEDESAIYGRDDERKILKELLLSEDGGSKIGVIFIVGMGGLGKTTLAKLLYNDHDVRHKFMVSGWAHIPPDLDIFTVTKTILESLTSKRYETDGLKILRAQLQQTLSAKKFLLVLDDIWYGRYVGWNNLNDIFNHAKVGNIWSLLARHAFVEGNYQQHPSLEIIGTEIAKRCGGLPLAAVELGGILRTKLSENDWSDVLNNCMWELTNDKGQPTLLSSYQYLPGPLKRCFAYCSIFPKNSILEKNMLVQLWIAEGLIPYPKGQKTWEEVAEEYFDKLVSMSLIHQCSNDDDKRNFEMHELIHDLAMTVSFPHCFRLDKYRPDKRVRPLSYNREEYDKFDELHELKGLRTLLALPLQDSPVSYYSVSIKLLFDLLSTETHLHVLSLSHYQNITKLPNSIGTLIYLRYLNLSGTQIKRLSYEICKLYNLQTLLLSKCWELIELPKDIGKLVNLRHLDIRGTKLKEMPVQISTLENLRTLSDFIVSVKDVGLKIGDLGKYPYLRGGLSISQLENVTDPFHAFEANLKLKREVDDLELRWSYTAPLNSQIQSAVLEKLIPSTDLKGLIISGYGGDKLPNWLGYSIFSNMVRLSILECRNCSGLPSLGKLGNLKELFISKMQSVKSVDIEFFGRGSPSFQPFLSLKTLRFDHMDEWEEWELIGGSSPEFPSLTHLSLEYCPKLTGTIPCDLPRLTYLSMNLCPELRGMTLHNLPSLTELELTECPLLMETSPPFDVFSQLTICLSSLQKLTLKNIPSLTSFPNDGLPKPLRSLHIDYCENLEFISHESFHNYSSLEHLTISNSCNPMTSFTLCSLPVLQSLYIGGCKHLKSVLIAEDESQQKLLFLRTITIEFCNELESVSLSGFPIPNLTHLTVRQCEKLYALPRPMNKLESLHKLKIDGLPNLKPVSRDELPLSLLVLHG